MIIGIEEALSNTINELQEYSVGVISNSSSCKSALECIKNHIQSEVSIKYDTYIEEIDWVLKTEALKSLNESKKKNDFCNAKIIDRVKEENCFDINNYIFFQDLNYINIETSKKALYSCGSAIGGGAVIGGLLIAVSGIFNLEIPAWIISACSAVGGLSVGVTTAVILIPEYDKKTLITIINAFLIQLKIDLLNHLESVIVNYNKIASEIIIGIRECEDE